MPRQPGVDEKPIFGLAEAAGPFIDLSIDQAAVRLRDRRQFENRNLPFGGHVPHEVSSRLMVHVKEPGEPPSRRALS